MRIVLKVLVLLVISGLCIWSCCAPPPTRTTYSIFLFYQNASGQDLLDSATPNYFKQDSISISWKNPDGTLGSLTPHAFKNINLANAPSGYYISINPYVLPDDKGNNGIVNNDEAILFLHLNKTTSDTLHFVFAGNALQKVTYNKVLIPPSSNSGNYPFQFPSVITK